MAMSNQHNAWKLTSEIIELSEAKEWDSAKREWIIESIFRTERPGTCLCGHFPIVEHCVLLNRQNGNTVIVGNVCVKKFIGLPSDKLFQSVNRVLANSSRALAPEVIDYAFRKRWVNDWERRFYLDTLPKRRLSWKQKSIRVQINEKVVRAMLDGFAGFAGFAP